MQNFDNLINGEWRRRRQLQRRTSIRQQPGRRARPVRPGRRRPGRRGRRAPRTAAFPAWSTGSIQARSDALDKIGNEILARKEELGTLLAREEGKTRAEAHRRGHARGPHLQVLRRRMPAPVGRSAALGAPGHRRRDHARAGGRGRPHHAVELPDRDPRVEDRAGAGLRQLRGAEAGRPGARLRLGAGRDHQPLGHPGRRVQPGDGPRQRDRRCAGRPSRHPRHQLHRLGRRRPQHRGGRARRAAQEGAARDGRQEPAGGARRRRPRAGGRAQRAERLLSPPASAARRRAG